MRRGLLGGTFDPPHLAHLYAGEAAYRSLGLDVVTLIPAGSPWQKAAESVTGSSARWAMTKLAVEGVDYFDADDREVRRDGWTYTIETLESFPDDEELTLILGADAAARLPTWQRGEEVMARAAIAVAPRPGVESQRVASVLEGRRWEWLTMPLLHVSGTELRAMARAGHSLRFLVAEPVWRYIVAEGVYG
ncbi:MAG TPA: nicotinate-nucleotide adenylyltransferase [Acidimicrobiia bacterium]